MSFGATASRRREAARKHAEYSHICPRCDRKISGNAYYIHRRKCRADAARAALAKAAK